MRTKFPLLLSCLLLGACASTPSTPSTGADPEALPDGVIRAGSLANEKLMTDAMEGVAAKLASLGCEAPEEFLPYIVQEPQGIVGSRVWRELWVVTGCGQKYPLQMEFQKDGPGAATWVIRDA